MPEAAPDDVLQSELEDLFCDLVSRRSYEGALQRLFSMPRSRWLPASLFSAACPELDRRLAALPPHEGTLWLSWTDYPQCFDSSYCLVLAYHDDLWSKVAVFNRSYLRSEPPSQGLFLQKRAWG